MKCRIHHAMLLILLALLHACGGGGVGEGGTGSFASGPISGFGSVIVNGVRFDDATASVRDDDGNPRRRDELRLGMVVAIESTRIADGAAVARSIRFGSELVGLVTDIDVAGGRFSVFGLPVRTGEQTLFDERLAGGVAALRVGDAVEVYGTFDRANAELVATRVEPRLPSVPFRLRAPLEAIDAAAGTITVGGRVVSTGGTALPPGLQPGTVVRLRVQPTPGGLVATRVEAAALQAPELDDVRVEGRITSLTSNASFAVDGLPVDASGASFPAGTGGIRLGARVEVEGTISGGRLIASRVEAGNTTAQFHLAGAVANFDAAARSFVVRGVTVLYSANLRFVNGSEAELRDGRNVDVRGLPASDGTRLLAVRIELLP